MCQRFETQWREPRNPAGRRFSCVTFLLLSCAAGPVLAQDSAAPAPEPKSGLQIRSISAYGDYYSNGLASPTAPFQPGFQNGLADLGIGGGVVFDWTKYTERTSFSLSYTPSYTARVRYSSLNSLYHAMSLNLSRTLAPRWRFVSSVVCDFSNLQQYLFSPTSLSKVASASATYNDLAAALLTSNFANNSQLGVIVSSLPSVESPLRFLVYGERVLTASAQASLSYSISPRLSLSFTASGGRQQRVSEPQGVNGANSYLIPTSTSAGADISISYSLSPVTQVGGSVTTTRIFSGLQNFYATQSVATWERALGHRWLIQTYGGVGTINIVGPPPGNIVGRSLYDFPKTPHAVLGGRLAYKTTEHTFLASYKQPANGSYAFGASTTLSADGAWKWARPGSPWWTETSFDWQLIYGYNGAANTSGWRITAGLNRRLAPHIVFLTQYAFVSYAGIQTADRRFSQNAVRIEVTWMPHPISTR
jgi:hypothetical protein